MNQPYKDEQQLLAVNHGEGPALISAGPGSGKTYVITNRIHNLISNLGISPNKILVITFTKAAAKQMQERYLKIAGLQNTDVLFGTFHSVYLNFLKNFNSNSIPDIINPYKQKEIIKNIIHSSSKLSSNIYFSSDNAEDYLSAISFYKTSGYQIPIEYPSDLFINLFEQYEECMKSVNCMDYDDILLNCFKLFKEREDICNIIKDRFDYILVDEFQDINKIQYEILLLIINNSKNIFIVGDSDQSIYGFRGANPTVMSDFLKDFPDTKIIPLTTNYRSKKNIVEAADKVIAHNIIRLDKENHKSIESTMEGLFEIKIFNSREEQYEAIKKIYLAEEKIDNSVAILSRTNKDVYAIREYFENSISISHNSNISFDPKTEIYSDINAYIHFALNNDRESLLKILNKPNFYLSRNIFIETTVNLDNLSIKYRGSYKGNQLAIFNRHIKILKKSRPYAFVTYLFTIVGYKQYILDKYPTQKVVVNNILTSIQEKSALMKNLNELWDNTLFRSEVKDDTKCKYNIMTYHSSKGLEFDTVILPDVNEGKVPGRSSLKNDETEEERRLFYVAMTRAKSRLIISCIKGQDSMRVLPSRFITEFL